MLCFLTRSSVRILLLTDGDDDLLTFVVPGWVVDSAEDITEESLSLFTVLDPKLDVLIIGYGSHNTTTSRNPVDLKVILKMRQKGIPIDQSQAALRILFVINQLMIRDRMCNPSMA